MRRKSSAGYFAGLLVGLFAGVFRIIDLPSLRISWVFPVSVSKTSSVGIKLHTDPGIT